MGTSPCSLMFSNSLTLAARASRASWTDSHFSHRSCGGSSSWQEWMQFMCAIVLISSTVGSLGSGGIVVLDFRNAIGIFLGDNFVQRSANVRFLLRSGGAPQRILLRGPLSLIP